jgi:uncharacterized protein (DUF433 family)
MSVSTLIAFMEKHAPQVAAMRDHGPITLERSQGRPRTSFTDADVTDIVNRYRAKASMASIAKAYQTGADQIRRVLLSARVRIRRAGRTPGTFGPKSVYRSRMRSLALVLGYLETRKAPRIKVAGQPAAAVLRVIYAEMVRRAA